MGNTISEQKKQQLLHEARAALKLSFREKLNMFITRTGIGAIVGVLLYHPIRRIISDILPRIVDRTAENTQGKIIPLKSGVDLILPPEKDIQPYNELANKSRKWIHDSKTALLTSAALSVGIGGVLTLRSLAHYRKERKHLEKLYAARLDKMDENGYVPAPPTREELQSLRDWRQLARNGRDRGDLEDAASLAASTLYF